MEERDEWMNEETLQKDAVEIAEMWNRERTQRVF
jgi:hypothetical protein